MHTVVVVMVIVKQVANSSPVFPCLGITEVIESVIVKPEWLIHAYCKEVSVIRFMHASLASAAILMLIVTVAPACGGEKGPTMQNKPSAPAQPFVVLPASAIDGIVKDLHSANRLQNLISADNIGCRVYIQHEADVADNQAEVHDATDDIFIIMEGTTTLILGGQLDAPKETQPGEWRAAGITGGKEFKVSKGDVIMVPRGTPHRRVTTGPDVTLMVVKVSAPAKR
jgi:mannose-6-phosphate isomerase-like protein (cupin superfamily)